MLLPLISSSDVETLFASALVGFATFWLIHKAIQLLNH
jgi:hypothetical protein